MATSERLYSERFTTDPPQSRELDLFAVWRTVWSHKWIVAAVAVLCGGLAMYWAFTAIPIYRAEVVVTEVKDTGMNGLAGLANQLGGLASLAGLNLGGSGEERERQAILQSRHLAEEFVQRNRIGPLILKGAKKPSEWLAVQLFRRDVLMINEDKLKGVTSITIDWTDPAVAARWANEYVALANELMRTRAINDASRNVDYLNKQIAKTNVLEVQRVMYNLIETETKTLMLANARQEYAFTVVDPAVAPEQRISPKRTIMVLTGLLLGTFLGGIVALIYDRSARRRRLRPA